MLRNAHRIEEHILQTNLRIKHIITSLCDAVTAPSMQSKGDDAGVEVRESNPFNAARTEISAR
jgi:hypothetical protein